MQQVNLYLPELRPKKEWLTANTVATTSVGFLVLLIISAIFLNRGGRELEAQVVLIENQKAQAEARIKRITGMARPNQAFKLDRKLSALRKSIASREQIGQIIQGQNLGNQVGFSETMKALARQSLDSMSLAHIRVSRGGSFVEMNGLTKTPEDVPRYLQKLQDESSFEAVQFGLLSVNKSKKQSGVHEFSLGFDSVYDLASEEGNQ